MAPRKRKNVYAVKKGRVCGIYRDWEQVSGISGAQYRGFATEEEAAAYLGIALESSHPDNETVVGVTEGIPPASAAVKETNARGNCNSVVLAAEDGQSRRKRAKSSPVRRSEVSATHHVAAAGGPSSEPDFLQIYIDGACSGNGVFDAQAGVGVWFGDGDTRNVSEPLPGRKQSNQRAEIMAAIRALERIDGVVTIFSRPVELITDSMYLIQAMTEWIPKWVGRGWKTVNGTPVKNRDLLEKLDGLCAARSRSVGGGGTVFTHVAGHSGVPGNEAADRLATQAAQKSLEEEDDIAGYYDIIFCGY